MSKKTKLLVLGGSAALGYAAGNPSGNGVPGVTNALNSIDSIAGGGAITRAVGGSGIGYALIATALAWGVLHFMR